MLYLKCALFFKKFRLCLDAFVSTRYTAEQKPHLCKLLVHVFKPYHHTYQECSNVWPNRHDRSPSLLAISPWRSAVVWIMGGHQLDPSPVFVVKDLGLDVFVRGIRAAFKVVCQWSHEYAASNVDPRHKHDTPMERLQRTHLTASIQKPVTSSVPLSPFENTLHVQRDGKPSKRQPNQHPNKRIDNTRRQPLCMNHERRARSPQHRNNVHFPEPRMQKIKPCMQARDHAYNAADASDVGKGNVRWIDGSPARERVQDKSVFESGE
ncbi:hypothetical protein BJ741DRAFT_598865 [Chytriomyces cf. hyalinus JEL632]|nr:hypothetical protein BJ741DRAFT_598865 [Chytriomyces cf. hyalinus JEL632]